MKKEIGKSLLDIWKYVVSAIIISRFLGGLEQNWLVYLFGGAIAAVCFFAGIYFINEEKK